MYTKTILPCALLATLLLGCGGSTTQPSSKATLDMSDPKDVLVLGSNYTLDFGVQAVKPLSNKHFNVDITVLSNDLKTSGTFAQVNGIPTRNYKTQSDVEIFFKASATTAAGKKYQLNNYNVYYEDFRSTSVPAELAPAKIENDINNVKLWGNIRSAKINKDFVDANEGAKFSLNQMRAMNIYVRVADTLSNGMQVLPSSPKNSAEQYVAVSSGDCSTIESTSGELHSKGMLQQTCVDAHGYNIPLLIEDTSQQNSLAKAEHVKKVMRFYLVNLPASVTKAIADSKATMAFFYDEQWDERDIADFMEDNYRFQDLFATETTTVSRSEDKIDLSGERDAAFEEVLHFVHDYGIMNLATQDQNSSWAALQKDLDTLNKKAITAGLYYPNGMNANLPEAELDAESYDQEYLAYSLYAYYDVNHKGYVAQELKSATNIELNAHDAAAVAFMAKHFPSIVSFKAEFAGYPNN